MGVPVRDEVSRCSPGGQKRAKSHVDAVEGLRERVPAGFEARCAGADKPRIRVWPRQLSYDGFTNPVSKEQR